MERQPSQGDFSLMGSLGDRIKAVRMSWKWSQAELAGALKVDQASVSFWESDKIKPSGSSLIALAALFRVSLAALERGRGFTLPDPLARPGANRAEWSLSRTVALPSRAAHPLTVVDLGDGSCRGGELAEALISLSQGLKENRRAWVVLE